MGFETNNKRKQSLIDLHYGCRGKSRPYPLPLTPLPLTYLPLTYVTANRTFQIEFYDGKQANAGRSLSFSVTISIQREAEYAYIGGMSSLFPVVVVHQHDLYFLVE